MKKSRKRRKQHERKVKMGSRMGIGEKVRGEGRKEWEKVSENVRKLELR